MSVDIDSFDGPNEVATSKVQRARKEHKCDACGELIRRGDLYSYSFFVYDGATSTVKRCARCEVMFRELDERLPSGEVCAVELDCGHTYEDNFREPPPPELAQLAFVTADEAQGLLLKRVAKGAA
jgi:hypothetical protein